MSNDSNGVKNQQAILAELLRTASPNQLIQSPEVADRFKALYQTIHGKSNGTQIYETEKFHFLKLLQENVKLAACTKLSLYGCFLDVAVNGLSFDPSMKLCYLVPYNINIGTRENPKWESRCNLQISGYGELALRKKFGQIKYADNPILVYEGDHFKMIVKNGHTEIEYQMTLPRQTDNIVGCFISITRIDSSVDYKVLSMDEILKLRKFSKDPNSKAWVDGLPGMVQAKTIKHAFKSYPKVRTGTYSKMASDVIDEEAEIVTSSVMPEHIDYGVVDTEHEDVPAQLNQENQANFQYQNSQQHQQAAAQTNGHHFANEVNQNVRTVQVDDTTF